MKTNNLVEKTIDSKTIFKGRILNLKVNEVKLPNGLISSREVIEHKPAVVIIPVLNNGNILFIKQYRYPVKEILIELPAGKLNNLNENIRTCAKRELLEETGYSCKKLKKLLSFYTTPGFCNEILHLFLATNLCKENLNEKICDDDEFICTIEISLKKAISLIKQNKIKDAKSILAILYLDFIMKNNILNINLNNKTR